MDRGRVRERGMDGKGTTTPFLTDITYNYLGYTEDMYRTEEESLDGWWAASAVEL